MISTVHLPPMILQKFDPDLLLDSLGRIERSFRKIELSALKKLRPQDTGKRRAFESLKLKYMELYERKKKERSDYQTEMQEKDKKRPWFPLTGAPVRFKRYTKE